MGKDEVKVQTALRASDDIVGIAAQLVDRPVRQIQNAGLGGNNRVYRVVTDARCYALKFYPAQSRDPRDRLGAEYNALRFLWSRGIRSVPEPYAIDRRHGCGLYEWIDGTPVTTAGDVEADALASFLAEL